MKKFLTSETDKQYHKSNFEIGQGLISLIYFLFSVNNLNF